LKRKEEVNEREKGSMQETSRRAAMLFASPPSSVLLHLKKPTQLYLFMSRNARLMERRVAIHIALADAADGERRGLGRSGESRCSSSGRGFGVRVLLVVLYEQLDRGQVPC